MLVMRTPTLLNPPVKSSLLLALLVLLRSNLSLLCLHPLLQIIPSLPLLPLLVVTTRRQLLQLLHQLLLLLHPHPAAAQVTRQSLVVFLVKVIPRVIGIAAKHHAAGQVRLMLLLLSRHVLLMVSSLLMPMNR